MRSKRRLETIKAFDNDYKKLRKRHYDTDKFREPFRALIEDDADLLKTKFRPCAHRQLERLPGTAHRSRSAAGVLRR